MASIRNFKKARGTLPNLASLGLPQADVDKIGGLKEYLHATTLLREWAASDEHTPERWQNFARVGYVWRLSEVNGWFKTGRDAKEQRDALQKMIGYSLVHGRTCARFVDDAPLVKPATDWYKANEAKLENAPRKGAGLEWALSVIKAFKAFRTAKGKGLSDDAAFAEADKTLPKPRVMIERVITPQQLDHRKSALIASFAILFQAAWLNDPQHRAAASEALKVVRTWTDVETLFERLETVAYDAAKEGGITEALASAKDEPLEEQIEAAIQMFDFCNDALASPEEIDGGDEFGDALIEIKFQIARDTGGITSPDGNPQGGNPQGGQGGGTPTTPPPEVKTEAKGKDEDRMKTKASSTPRKKAARPKRTPPGAKTQ